MGLFDIFKSAFSNSTNTKKTNYVQPTKSNYIPTYYIEDWQPKLKYPKYDKLFSLQKYLESIDLPQDTITTIIESKNVFGEAKKVITHITEQIPLSEMCYHETIRVGKWIKLMALWESPPEYIFENTFNYILLRLGWMCHWDMLQQKALNISGLNDILDACKHDDYKKIISYFDSDILSCFALSHIKSNKTLSEAVAIGFNYLEMNTKHNGSAHGSFYNLYGKQQIKCLIGKIIESAYIQNKFSSKRLFLKEDDGVRVNTQNLKYDVSKMKTVRGFYLPNIEDVENIKNDVMHLNTFLLKAKMLISSFPAVQINAEDLVFRFGKVLKDESTEFCVFTYTPNTPTGKASKYPLKLGFWCDRTSKERQVKQGRGFSIIPPNGIQGDIEFLANGELGKARVIIVYNGSFYIVNILDKKGEKIITKIESNNNKGERIELYNANRKD